MANDLKLTPETISQHQIDALVRLYHTANPIITSSILTHNHRTAVISKYWHNLVKAEKAFWKTL